MYQTYLNLSPIAKECAVAKEDMVAEYQECEDPTILAKLFTNNYKLIIKESKKYFGLSMEDIASFSIEELHMALLTFNIKKETNFLTYYCTCLRNRLRAETQANNYDKRKSMNNYIEYKEEVLNPVLDEALCALDATADQVGMTDREKQYCQYVMKDTVHTKDKDFADFANISSAAVCYIKKSLQTKLKSYALA